LNRIDSESVSPAHLLKPSITGTAPVSSLRNGCDHRGDCVDSSQCIVTMLPKLWSRKLLGHDDCNVFACLDIHNHNALALYTLLQKTNLDCYMLYSLMCAIIPSSYCNCHCIVHPHTGAISHCLLLLSALQVKSNCFHVLNFYHNLGQCNCCCHSSA
jgi:hypothetical protein